QLDTLIVSQLRALVSGKHPNLIPVGADDAHLGDANAATDAVVIRGTRGLITWSGDGGFSCVGVMGGRVAGSVIVAAAGLVDWRGVPRGAADQHHQRTVSAGRAAGDVEALIGAGGRASSAKRTANSSMPIAGS